MYLYQKIIWCGSGPDPTGRAHDAPQTSQLDGENSAPLLHVNDPKILQLPLTKHPSYGLFVTYKTASMNKKTKKNKICKLEIH